MKALAIITTILLSSCAGEITPEQARAGAEAASAWLDVVSEAREILNDK